MDIDNTQASRSKTFSCQLPPQFSCDSDSPDSVVENQNDAELDHDGVEVGGSTDFVFMVFSFSLFTV